MPGSPSPTPRGSWRTRRPSWAACTGPSYLTWGTPDQSTAWAEQLHKNSPHGWKLCKLRWSGQTRITILSDTLKGRLIKNINRALDFFYFSFASCLALVGVYVGWGSCKSNSKPRDFWRFGAFFNTLHFWGRRGVPFPSIHQQTITSQLRQTIPLLSWAWMKRRGERWLISITKPKVG